MAQPMQNFFICALLSTNMSVRDVLIVGAGPSGLAAAIAAKQHGLDYQVLEQGVLVNSIFHFPRSMVFFTTPELLEIGGLPFVSPYDKPTRHEALRYYRRVAEMFDLPITFGETVTLGTISLGIAPQSDAVTVAGSTMDVPLSQQGSSISNIPREEIQERNEAQAIDLLRDVRNGAGRFGGSHAQRDVLHLTLLRAVERIRNTALAQTTRTLQDA
jgi:hypothetical protein